jgi:hypothetical protein
MVEEIERDGVSDGRAVVLPSYPHGGSELSPKEFRLVVADLENPNADDVRHAETYPAGSQTPARQTGVAQARACHR